jgi:excisionase family DNA binding protein
MEKLLSMEELSRLLGITKSTLYSWTSKKIIPHRKLSSRLIRFEESEILDWLDKKSVYPDAQHSSPKNHCHKRHEKSAPYKAAISRSHVERLIENAKKEVLGDVS